MPITGYIMLHCCIFVCLLWTFGFDACSRIPKDRIPPGISHDWNMVLSGAQLPKDQELVTLPFEANWDPGAKLGGFTVVRVNTGEAAVFYCRLPNKTSAEQLLIKHQGSAICLNGTLLVEDPIQKYGCTAKQDELGLTIYNVSYRATGTAECYSKTNDSEIVISSFRLKLNNYRASDVFVTPMQGNTGHLYKPAVYTCIVPFPKDETDSTCCGTRFVWRYKGGIEWLPGYHPLGRLYRFSVHCPNAHPFRDHISGTYNFVLSLDCVSGGDYGTVECWYKVNPDEEKYVVQTATLNG